MKAVGASKFRTGIVLMGSVSVTPKKKKVKLMQLVELLNMFEAKSQGQRQIVVNHPDFVFF